MKLEIRQVPGLEVRAEGEDGAPVIAGRGIPYGEWSSDLGGFKERLMPGTFREDVANGDVRALYNHNADVVLGRRSTGSLRLTESDTGVHYEVDVNVEDRAAMDAVARIRRGDVDGNSFGFYVENREDQEWEERDGMLWRTVRRARLRELGPQTFPAYPQSDVAVRSVDAVMEEAQAYLREIRAAGDPGVLRRRMEMEALRR